MVVGSPGWCHCLKLRWHRTCKWMSKGRWWDDPFLFRKPIHFQVRCHVSFRELFSQLQIWHVTYLRDVVVGKNHYPSGKLTWLAGKSPCYVGNTSSNGPFPIAMLVYQSVICGCIRSLLFLRCLSKAIWYSALKIMIFLPEWTYKQHQTTRRHSLQTLPRPNPMVFKLKQTIQEISNRTYWTDP